MKKIYIDDVGSGFPLVLVHGYLGSSEMWCNQRDYFSKSCRVISPALPGFGESSNIQSLDSINKMAQFVIDILEEKKIQKFNLLGHSMGGMIVQEITKIIGDRVNKLICFATGSIGEIPGRFETIDETRNKLKKDGIELFSGEFWAGSKAKELGLIDELGDASQILKEKFGEDVVIKKFEKPKGWFSKKFSSSINQVDQLATILEERSIWQRYGF